MRSRLLQAHRSQLAPEQRQWGPLTAVAEDTHCPDCSPELTKKGHHTNNKSMSPSCASQKPSVNNSFGTWCQNDKAQNYHTGIINPGDFYWGAGLPIIITLNNFYVEPTLLVQSKENEEKDNLKTFSPARPGRKLRCSSYREVIRICICILLIAKGNPFFLLFQGAQNMVSSYEKK